MTKSQNPKSESKLPRLPKREADSHKGDYGRALLIGGSRGMTGAISLAGMAALRAGAGLAQLAVPEVCQDVVAGHEPSYTTVGLLCDDAGRIRATARDQIVELAKEATALGLGPGLGRSEELIELVGWLYKIVPNPIVFDADALNALAEKPEILASPAGPRILTPHVGEFFRLIGEKPSRVEDRRARAYEFAAQYEIVLVLKGHETLITDGHRTETSTAGNPGMATGGSGDVLTGLITALLCQGLDAWKAARLGVHLHGTAGDLGAAELGETSLIASDLVRFLPRAIQDYHQSPST